MKVFEVAPFTTTHKKGFKVHLEVLDRHYKSINDGFARVFTAWKVFL